MSTKFPNRANSARAMHKKIAENPELAERIKKKRSEAMKKYWKKVRKALSNTD